MVGVVINAVTPKGKRCMKNVGHQKWRQCTTDCGNVDMAKMLQSLKTISHSKGLSCRPAATEKNNAKKNVQAHDTNV